MKGARIAQVVVFLLLALYLVLFNNWNPQPVNLPWLVPVAPVFVIIGALLAGWLVGWIPARMEMWRRGREIRRLRVRLAELEQAVPRAYAPDGLTPVIPDRPRHHNDPEDEATSL